MKKFNLYLLRNGRVRHLRSSPEPTILMDAADDHANAGGLFSEPRHANTEKFDVPDKLYIASNPENLDTYVIARKT